MSNACGKKEQKKVKIIYQDDSLLVLNKPAGLVTLRVETYQGDTLQDWLEKNLAILVRNRAGIAHRLDKETSGLILVAKNNHCFDYLQDQFKKRKVKKTYWTLVRGNLTGQGEILAPVGRRPGDRFKFGVVPGGKRAKTSYQVIRNLKIDGEDYSLIKVRPETGRTHQIRVHFKYLGHPIFGDPLYGGKKERGRSMFLVAKRIEFDHPSGKKMRFSLPLPNLLSELVNNG